MRLSPSLILFLIIASQSTAAPTTQVSFEGQIRPLLGTYCLSCHGPEKKKGDLDLSPFNNTAKVLADKDVWYDVASRLENHDMPPKKGKAKQPTDQERALLLSWIGATVGHDQVDCSKIATDETQRFYRGHVMSRRLTRAEYNNTIRDLIGLDIHPGNILPEDGAGGEGFDTVGDSLFISAIQIEKYLQAADQVLDVVVPDGTRGQGEMPPEIAEARKRILQSLPDKNTKPSAAAKTNLTNFARRAFRRPPQPTEIDRFVTVFDRAQERKLSFEASLRLALKGILISPRFLFLVEPEPEKEGVYKLGDYPLASRLSYFLWSSMPDDELFKLAEEKRLTDTETLRQQVRRMLKDPRSRALGENFGGQWLAINTIGGASRPDAKRFPEFNDLLAAAMRDEATLFVGAVLCEDHSLLDLIDSDYTFLNDRLAKHYAIPGIKGSEMRKVQLPESARASRGGLLGMGAILTSTSYPLRTSPVLRGKWVMEQILGGKVPPPPPTVPSLSTDDAKINGLTFRQRLEQHRSQPDCAACHQKMDPLGFGLENFDPVGRWRTAVAGEPVDAHGELPSGEKFSGPAELRHALMQRRQEFLRTFCRKMLGYALGRGLDRFDDCVINDCLKALEANDDHSSLLFEQIVLSVPFRYRYSKK